MKTGGVKIFPLAKKRFRGYGSSIASPIPSGEDVTMTFDDRRDDFEVGGGEFSDEGDELATGKLNLEADAIPFHVGELHHRADDECVSAEIVFEAAVYFFEERFSHLKKNIA